MTKKNAKKSPITWSSKRVPVDKILPTEKNYKIKTDLGRERLQQSLKLFGLAGNVIVNPESNGTYRLIDGNSRLAEAKEKKEKIIWVSFPSRKLTPKEFSEMSAMYDFAKAGEVDMERIQGDLGTTEDFYTKWGLTVPMQLLSKLGNNADIAGLEYPGSKPGKADPKQTTDVCLVQLLFTSKQKADFEKWEEHFMKKFKVSNTTDVVYKVFKELYGKGK